jgi:hypothetical protein
VQHPSLAQVFNFQHVKVNKNREEPTSLEKLFVVMLRPAIFAALAASGAATSEWEMRRVALATRDISAVSAWPNRTFGGSFDHYTAIVDDELAPLSAAGAADATLAPAELVLTVRPEQWLSDDALPKQWDWRAVKVADEVPLVDFTKRIRNQFLPFWSVAAC